jgi:hypothetical protein
MAVSRKSARPDKRRYPRRAKSIRFRFEQGGDQHFAVSTLVSLSGAFLKASHIPKKGTVLTLLERFNPDAIDLYLRGQVVWTHETPSLEHPDTGFGLRFIELSTRADPAHIEEFLRALDPSNPEVRSPEIHFEERAQGAYAVYRFATGPIEPEAFAPEEPGFLEQDEPAVVDLDRELDRMTREDARGRSTPPPPLAPAPIPAAEPPPVRAPSLAEPSRPEGPPSDVPNRQRSRRRSVTGIFTALFSRNKGGDLPVDRSDATPGFVDAGQRVNDARRPKVLLVWGSHSTVARLETLSRQAATLWTSDIAPTRGLDVEIHPVGTPPGLDLVIHGRVESLQPPTLAGVSWVQVAFSRVDERGKAGRFQDYLRLLNGPGGDEK